MGCTRFIFSLCAPFCKCILCHRKRRFCQIEVFIVARNQNIVRRDKLPTDHCPSALWPSCYWIVKSYIMIIFFAYIKVFIIWYFIVEQSYISLYLGAYIHLHDVIALHYISYCFGTVLYPYYNQDLKYCLSNSPNHSK